jgi:uncharacterized protein
VFRGSGGTGQQKPPTSFRECEQAHVKDLIRYDKMVETALRGVVREVLARTAASGLPGAHHFYITLKTAYPGVEVPDHLRADYPDEMTIVLEHQYWDLEVKEDRFSVTLSFKNRPERLVVPFESITAFADPAVKFGLQFQAAPADAANAPAAPAESDEKAPPKPARDGQVVTLDAFRKK